MREKMFLKPKGQLFKRYAKFYDKIFFNRDYDKEVCFTESMIGDAKGKRLLDMACGTGSHAKRFAESGFEVTGVDINPEMLKIAREKARGLDFFEGSMLTFKSKKKFDVITCLFSSINFIRDLSELRAAIKTFHSLLKKGGILIMDIHLVKGQEEENKRKRRDYGAFADTFSEKGLQVFRFCHWRSPKEISGSYDVNYLIIIRDKGRFELVIDGHRFARFNVRDVKEIMSDAGFNVDIYDNFTSERYDQKSRIPTFVGIKK